VPFSRLTFSPECDAEFFAGLPATPAVFVLRGEDPNGEPYVSKTSNLRRRLTRLLGPAEDRSRRLNLRDRVHEIEFAFTGSDFESGLVLYHTLRREFPKSYAKRLKLRPAPLVRLMLENQYPRVTVTTRIATLRGRSLYYGPFQSRVAAEKFANDVLDFFKIRRCTDELNPDPSFPGCVYSEMKMCLAPCFRGCSDSEYNAEVARVQAFFDTRGLSLEHELARQRDEASMNLEFEAAAALHTRIEKLAPVRQQCGEAVQRLDTMRALIVQRSAEAESVALFRVECGLIGDPIPFSLQLKSAEHTQKPQSMESRVQQALAAAPPLESASVAETVEQLAYLKRWVYRTNKTGEIFFADGKGELPWRRVVRGISRVYRGEKPGGELNETARDYWINRGRAAEINPEDYNV